MSTYFDPTERLVRELYAYITQRTTWKVYTSIPKDIRDVEYPYIYLWDYYTTPEENEKDNPRFNSELSVWFIENNTTSITTIAREKDKLLRDLGFLDSLDLGSELCIDRTQLVSNTVDLEINNDSRLNVGRLILNFIITRK